jgi:hypothetical protein
MGRSRSKRRKRPVHKKIREWYSTYCAQIQEAREAGSDLQRMSLRVWAAIEADKCEGTSRGKILDRFLGGRKEDV